MSTKQDNGGHWYAKTGEPMHWVKRASGEGTRPTTLADARKLDLLPSVTTILRTLDKPALTRWMILEAVKAVVTDPDRPGEGLDAKVERVLSEERQQEQEAAQAADLGTRIHEAIEWNMSKGPYRGELLPYIEPAVEHLHTLGTSLHTEKILVGDGYAGKTDLILQSGPDSVTLVDFKTTKKVPDKGSWPEHRLQLAAYARAWNGDGLTRTGNLYISTAEPGKFRYYDNGDWQRDWQAFEHLLKYWQLANNFGL